MKKLTNAINSARKLLAYRKDDEQNHFNECVICQENKKKCSVGIKLNKQIELADDIYRSLLNEK